VTIAVRARLEQLLHLREAGLADRLLAIGADAAPRLRESYYSAGHVLGEAATQLAHHRLPSRF
jgi:hypothetical protein